MEVEVKPYEVPFDGQSTTVSELGSAAVASVAISDFFAIGALYGGMNSGDFKWRARMFDEDGRYSDWVEFGNDDVDFSLTAVPFITQVVSDYPSEVETVEWASSLYAGGDDEVCGATIESCGCALSSLSTLAYHHGIITGEDGTAVNPKNLNNWLLANGGFDAANNVKWLAALEYFAPEDEDAVSYFEYIGTTDSVSDTDELLAETPVIAFDIELFGGYSHFFVLDSELDEGYEISDPQWYKTETTGENYSPADKQQAYGDTFNSARLIRVDTGALALGSALEIHHSAGESLVTDAYGNKVGEDFDSDEVYDEVPSGEFVLEPSIYSRDDIPEVEAVDWKVVRITDTDSPYFIISISGEAAAEYFLSIFYRDTEGKSNTTSYEGFFPENGQIILTAGSMTLEGKLLTLLFWMKGHIEEFSGVLGEVIAERIQLLEQKIFTGDVVFPSGQENRLERWFEAYLSDDLSATAYIGLLTSVLSSD